MNAKEYKLKTLSTFQHLTQCNFYFMDLSFFYTQRSCLVIYVPGDPLILHVKVAGSPSSTIRFCGSVATVGASSGISVGGSIGSGDLTGTVNIMQHHRFKTIYTVDWGLKCT